MKIAQSGLQEHPTWVYMLTGARSTDLKAVEQSAKLGETSKDNAKDVGKDGHNADPSGEVMHGCEPSEHKSSAVVEDEDTASECTSNREDPNETGSTGSTGVYFNNSSVLRSVYPLRECSTSDRLKHTTGLPSGKPLAVPPTLRNFFIPAIPKRVILTIISKHDSRSATPPSPETIRETKRIKTDPSFESPKAVGATVTPVLSPSPVYSADQKIFVEAATALCESKACVPSKQEVKKRKYVVGLPPPPFALPVRANF